MNLISKNLLIKPSPIHGWGVFIQENIQKNDIILQSAVINLPHPYNYPPNLVKYIYVYNKKLFLALGEPSMINSSNEPNVKFDIDEEKKIISIISLKNITVGEEITLKYL